MVQDQYPRRTRRGLDAMPTMFMVCEGVKARNSSSGEIFISLVVIAFMFLASGCASVSPLRQADNKIDGIHRGGAYVLTEIEKSYSCDSLEREVRDWVKEAETYFQEFKSQVELPPETVALAIERSKGVATAGYSASHRFDDAIARADAYNSQLDNSGCTSFNTDVRLQPDTRLFATMRRQANTSN